MADIQEVRRQQLRRLVSEHEGMTNLARKLGLSKGAYISQLLTNPPLRDISEKTARKWEKMLRLPEGWFDRGITVNNNAGLNGPLMTQVLKVVLEALQREKITLPPEQLAGLINMQYTDALPTGRVDADRVAQLVALLKR